VAAYVRNPQSIPDDTPGGSTVRQAVKDQNSTGAIDDLFVNLNAHSNNEDGKSHVQIDASLTDIETNYIPVMEGLLTDTQLSESNAATSASTATTQAGIATTQAGLAADQVVLAADQVTLAENQVTLATAQKTKAQEWAENPVDDPVEVGQFSALHWSAKSESFANSINPSNILFKDNTDPFTPSDDYNPSTKKYADDLNVWVADDTRAKTALNASGSAPIFAIRASCNK